ncbi:MAG: hypothetical protein J5J00_16050 [Deltaproteobacteria bacterium]|nr:hypothetical protein [Deltaproteobacteria bacterium]
MRSRRMFTAGRPYELILRVKENLPFACKETIKLILESCLARAQRDLKVTLCHHLWMGNHVHFLLVLWDAQACVNFYQELQKKITEAYKRLLGKARLSIWEGDPVVAEILDLEKAIEKIAYIYANPARANLVANISQYPGISSWKAFEGLPASASATHTKRVPWIRSSTIPTLKSLNLSEREDYLMAEALRSKARLEHNITLSPNAWMLAFGIDDPDEIADINARIKLQIEEKEAQAEEERNSKKRAVLGVQRLLSYAIYRPHIPKKRERRIYVLSSIVELRIEYIARFKAFCEECRECYEQFLLGGNPQWPPGALRPPGPPLASLLY